MNVFDKIWTWKQCFFREKSEKKGILLTFLAHNRVVFWQNLRFFDQSCAWEQGVFHEKFEKKGHESTVFWDKISQILRKILKILKVSVKSQRVWLNVKGFGQSKSQVMVIFIQLLIKSSSKYQVLVKKSKSFQRDG